MNAAHAFHAMIRGVDKSIPLDEIEDAMFSVGWMPTDDDSGLAEPWPLVMVEIAEAVNTEMADFKKKKKLAATEQ